MIPTPASGEGIDFLIYILYSVSAMLAIKLQRIGKKHQPSYRLVVAEKRSKLNAPPVEDLGSYNPSIKKANFVSDRVFHWIKMGAQPTATVHNLLVKEGVLNAPKMKIKVKAKGGGDLASEASAKEAATAAKPAEAAA